MDAYDPRWILGWFVSLSLVGAGLAAATSR